MKQRKALRCAILLCLSTVVFGIPAVGEDVLSATVCQIKKSPAAYNHKLVEVTGFVSHDFEDFTLFDPTCNSWPAIWLEYGGKAKSDTMYCCGDTAGHQRSKELVVEQIPVPLVANERFN